MKKITKNVSSNQPKAKDITSAPVKVIESRREFLQKIWKWLGALALLEILFLFLGFLFSGRKNIEDLKPKQLLEAGTADAFKINSVTAFRGGRFYLARLEDGGFMALSLRCTHLGCSINWEEEKNRFICPCHSSAFYLNGEVQNPPAPNALDYFPVIVENGIIKVDIGTKLERTRFEKSQVTYI